MNAPMTPEQLAEILARAAAATAGPWCTDSWEIYQGTEYVPGMSPWIGETCRGVSGAAELEQDRADASFVAAARTDVLALVAEVQRLRARVAELETAAAVDALGALPMPTGVPEPSPWERAVAGLNALADSEIPFAIELDGHIANPFGDEHIEWDQDASRWRLVHDDEDAAPAPGALDKRPPTIDDIVRALHTKHADSGHCEHDGEVWPCPTLAALDRTNIPAQRDQRGQA